MKQFTQSILDRSVDYVLLLTLILFPLIINISIISINDIDHPVFSVNISVADFLIGLAFLLWAIKLAIYGAYQIKFPPKPILALMIALFLSAINAYSVKDWGKEIIQFSIYFFVFYFLLINCTQRWSLLKLRNILFIVASFIVLMAAWQYLSIDSSPYLIRGVFENRNLFGAYLCIIIPLIYADFTYSNSLLRKTWLGFLLLISLLVLMSGSAFLSIFIGLVVVFLVSESKRKSKILIEGVFFFALLILLVPHKNIEEIKNSISLYEKGRISENYYRVLTILGDSENDYFFLEPIDEGKLLGVSSKLSRSSKFPDLIHGTRYAELDNEKHVKNRYIEMQASLNILSKNSLTGIGLGNFQNFIGTYYNGLPKVNTAEPHQRSNFLILAATTGLLGVTSLIWIFVYSLKFAYKAYRSTTKYEDKGAYLGAIGALSASLIEGFFTSLFASGLMLLFVFVIYMATKEK